MGDPYKSIFDAIEQDAANGQETDAERRLRIKNKLREGGADLPFSDSELLDLIGQIMDQQGQIDKSAENAFQQLLDSGVPGDVGFRRASQVAKTGQGLKDQSNGLLEQLIQKYIGSQDGPSGPKPSVIQGPNNDELFKTIATIASGPSPESLFRDVFSQAFPSSLAQPSPFQQFTQDQQPELEKRFMQQVFNEFTQPGYIDQLKADYTQLARQGDNQRVAGTGGEIPSYEDFVRNHVQSNYMQFLAGEKPKLEQAFQLTSPQNRGERAQGQGFTPRRIL